MTVPQQNTDHDIIKNNLKKNSYTLKKKNKNISKINLYGYLLYLNSRLYN